jgi:hypothetical protein
MRLPASSRLQLGDVFAQMQNALRWIQEKDPHADPDEMNTPNQPR